MYSIKNNLSNSSAAFEVVISDNASYDNTKDVVCHFHNEIKIRYIRNKTDIGGERNLCQAIAASSGKYVWLLGDDDPLTEGICDHVLDIVQTHPELCYVFMPRKLVNQDLSPTSTGVQPKGIINDCFYQSGKILFEAYDGQIVGLLGFYGSNLIRRELWLDSLNELQPNLNNWFHILIILNAIKNVPCAIAGRVGVQARWENVQPNGIDKRINSRVWIDYAVPVMHQAINWGYSKTLCEDSIRTIFRAHAPMYVMDKACGKRSDNLLILAKRLNCERVIDLNSIWMMISFLPRFSLIPLLWIRILRRKIRKR